MRTTKRSRPTRLLAGAAAATLLSLTVAACSDDAEPKGDATITFGTGALPEGWTPGTGGARVYLTTSMEALVAPDESTPDDLTDVVPSLATKWDVSNEAITFNLRDDVKFQDETPFNAEAVKANIEFAKKNPGQFTGLLAPIESVDVVDEFTVRFNLGSPAPSLLHDLSDVVGLIASPKALASGATDERPVGTGPWMLDEKGSTAGQRWRFVRWDGYWGDVPEGAPETFEIVVTPDSQARLAAMKSGEIDIADLETDQALQAEDAGLKVLTYPAIAASFIMFDRGPGGLFEDVRVRQAVCQAFDTEKIERTLKGYVKAKPQRFAEGSPFYNPEIEPIEYDPDAARATLKRLGVQIDAPMAGIAGATIQQELFAGMLNEVGLNIKVQAIPESEFHGVWNSGEFPVGWGGESEVEPYAWYQGFYQEKGPYNPTGKEPAELADTVSAAVAAGDSDEAAQSWRDAVKLMHDEFAMCPFFDVNQYLVSDPDRVENVLPTSYTPGTLRVRELVVK